MFSISIVLYIVVLYYIVVCLVSTRIGGDQINLNLVAINCSHN